MPLWARFDLFHQPDHSFGGRYESLIPAACCRNDSSPHCAPGYLGPGQRPAQNVGPNLAPGPAVGGSSRAVNGITYQRANIGQNFVGQAFHIPNPFQMSRIIYEFIFWLTQHKALSRGAGKRETLPQAGQRIDNNVGGSKFQSLGVEISPFFLRKTQSYSFTAGVAGAARQPITIRVTVAVDTALRVE